MLGPYAALGPVGTLASSITESAKGTRSVRWVCAAERTEVSDWVKQQSEDPACCYMPIVAR